MKKIYGFCGYLWGNKDTIKVEEFEVIRETDKQYKIKNGFPSTVNKATMGVSDYRFYETREEAVKGLAEHCKSSIRVCENRIDYEKGKISKYQRTIEECEKETKQ